MILVFNSLLVNSILELGASGTKLHVICDSRQLLHDRFSTIASMIYSAFFKLPCLRFPSSGITLITGDFFTGSYLLSLSKLPCISANRHNSLMSVFHASRHFYYAYFTLVVQSYPIMRIVGKRQSPTQM